MGALTAKASVAGPARPGVPGRESAGNGGGVCGKVLVFEVAGRLFAMELDRLEEIVADLAVTPVPRTPPFFLGLVNLRGGVIPLLDARSRLGCPAGRDEAGQCFVLVRADNRVLGLAVDRVRGIVEAGAARREALPGDPALGLTAGFAREALHVAGWHGLALVLDIDAVCRFSLTLPGPGTVAVARPAPAGSDAVRAGSRTAASQGGRLFTFEAGGLRLGLPLEALRRIVPYAAPAAPPHRRPGLLGYLDDNQRLTPIVDPIRLLRPAQARTYRPGFILFLALAGRPVGLAVEGLGRIIAWTPPVAAMDPASPVLDVVPDGGAGAPVFVLSPEALLGPDFLEGLDGAGALAVEAGQEAKGGASGLAGLPNAAPTDVYVRFGLGDETMALPMDRVREVSPVEALAPVPRAPRGIAGLLNLRGTIIPAMDLRQRLGLPGPRPEPDGQARILVAASGDGLCGLVVDRVYKPLSLARDRIAPLPAGCDAEVVRRFVLGAARVDGGRPLLLLDLDGVVGDDRPAPGPARASVLSNPREAGHADQA